MSGWKTPREETGPPYRGHVNSIGRILGSTSSLESGCSNAASMKLKPSKHYNVWYVETERKQTMSRIEDENEKIGNKNSIEKGQSTGSSLLSIAGSVLKTSNKASGSKAEAIRDWEARQMARKNEKGLFARMDAKQFQGNCYESWAKSPKFKEIIRTIYVPVKESQTTEPEGIQTPLPPYSGKKTKRIYPRCPSPDTEDELKKIRNWVEYNEESREFSVDTPTALQSGRTSQGCSSSALGTLFEGFDGEDSFVESDEINRGGIDSEYEADTGSSGGEESFDSYTDESETGKACRLTKTFHIGQPKGRRCPKARKNGKDQMQEELEQANKPRSTPVLRLRGGAKRSTGESEAFDNDRTMQTTVSEARKRTIDMQEYTEKVTPPSKRTKEISLSPGTPSNESERAHSFHHRGRTVLKFFEKFKNTHKKKLTAVAQQELDRGVDMVNDLLTEICSENMIIYGRYLELKETAEERRKKVEFVAPRADSQQSKQHAETFTTDTEGEPTKTKKTRKRKRKRNSKISEAEKSQESDKGAGETGNSGSERPASAASTKSRKNKKEAEKEIIEKSTRSTD